MRMTLAYISFAWVCFIVIFRSLSPCWPLFDALALSPRGPTPAQTGGMLYCLSHLAGRLFNALASSARAYSALTCCANAKRLGVHINPQTPLSLPLSFLHRVLTVNRFLTGVPLPRYLREQCFPEALLPGGTAVGGNGLGWGSWQRARLGPVAAQIWSIWVSHFYMTATFFSLGLTACRELEEEARSCSLALCLLLT